MLLTRERRDLYLPLDELEIPTGARAKLEALGITTLEELRAFWSYENKELLTEYLGDSPLRLVAMKPTAGAVRGLAARGPGGSVNVLATGPVPPLRHMPRGVVLPPSQRLRRAAPPSLPPATRRAGTRTEARTVVSMTRQFPAPRNQESRGTCVAFASVAFLEFHLAGGEAKTKPLSEQFVYWACKETDKIPTVSGTYLRFARKVLATRGACRGATWKYETLPVGPTEGQGPPPAGAEEEAKQNRWTQARALTRKQIVNIDELRKRLDAKEPIVFSVRTFLNWDFQVVQETGEIPMPLPGATPDGGHAIVLAGYELNDMAPGGGAFIFRNSWGKDWARLRGRHGGGYGTLFFDYVKDNALEGYC
jgi:Papain family cysteine protease